MSEAFFNPDEVFEIAELIERNGNRFYLEAAKGQPIPANQKMLEFLAKMEERHEQTFREMRKTLTGGFDVNSNGYDPDNLAESYLKAMIDGVVFDFRSDPSRKLHEGIPFAEVLKIAIGLEKDSIVFYLGIKAKMTTDADKEKIEHIIKEEMKHVSILSEQLKLQSAQEAAL